MDHASLLELYDLEERREADCPGLRREATAHVVRLIDRSGPGSMILYSRLSEANADAVIGEEVDYFTRLSLSFEWKVFAHDAPLDLNRRLENRGFVLDGPEAVMVLDLETNQGMLAGSAPHEVRRVSDPQGMADVLLVENGAWGEDHARLVRSLAGELEIAPERLSLYVAYAEDRPVSAGWVRFSARGKFASLWGGSTLPGFRRRGFYTALLRARLKEAVGRGFRFVTIDAMPSSQPIVEKHGFALLTRAQACRWRP